MSRLEIYKNGNRYWRNDKLNYHRLDGPACEFADGHKLWFVNGLRHRSNGPALENADGDKEWFLDGEQYTEEEYKELIQKGI